MIRKTYTPLAALAGLALAAGSAHAQLLVYEGFDYTDVGEVLTGKGGSTEIGLDDSWANADGGNTMFLKEGSLQFGDLAISGNHIGFSSNLDSDRFNRPLSSSVISTIGSTGESDGALYFSFLFEKLQNNFSADREGFALMNGVLPHARFDGTNNPGALGRHGFAVAAVDNSSLRATIFDGTDGTRLVSTGSVPITVVNGGSNTDTSNVAVNFIVGEILFNQGTDGADIFNLYHATNNSLDPEDLVLAATIEGNVDESLLDTLNLTRQVNVNYDEIRIGLTLADVMPIAPPPAPESSFQVVITPAVAPATGFDLEWESQSGKRYNLYTSTDLAGPINTWTLLEGDIEATPPANVKNVPEDGPRRFYAVEEFDAPPPPPLFSSDFEEDDGGFTVSTSEGSAWEWGTPDSDNGQPAPEDLVLTAGNSGTNAWGTNLGIEDDGFYLNPTTTSLRSPVIDLTTATTANLSFAEAADFASADSAEVYVISATDETEIAGPIHTSSTGAILTADWAIANGGDPIALPPAALGQPVRLEWRYTGNTPAFLGWYIDDVTVNAE